VGDFNEYSCTSFFANYVHGLNESSEKIKEIKKLGIFEDDLFDELLEEIANKNQVFVDELEKRQNNKEMYNGSGVRQIELLRNISYLEESIRRESSRENTKRQKLIELGVSEEDAIKAAPDYDSSEDLEKLAALKKEYDGWCLFYKSGLMEDAPMTVHELTKYVPKSQISYFRNQKNND